MVTRCRTAIDPNAFAHPASMLTLEPFRLDGALIALGDANVAPHGLSSARWQVADAVAEARGALPVAGTARQHGPRAPVAAAAPRKSRFTRFGAGWNG